MTRLELPEVEFKYYNEQNVEVGPGYDPEFEFAHADLEELLTARQKIIDECSVRKPVWFREAEGQARAFLGSLAFTDLGRVHLLREDELLDEVSMREPATTVADVDPLLKDVFVRQQRMSEVHRRRPAAAAGILVHEFVHAAAQPPRVAGMHRNNDATVSYHFRTGFGMASDKGGGAFFEEGFAEFARGWFNRAQEDPRAASIGIHGKPKKELPAYFEPPSPEMTTGPDGYATELLAWGAAHFGILSVSDFIANMFDTRRAETATTALRIHSRTVDRLCPGLYVYLRDLPYSKDNWRRACDLIYDIVTAPRAKSAGYPE